MPHPEPPQPAADPRRFPWRRLLQYRLRTLLILTTLVAVWFAWWSHSARRQRETLKALSKAGGSFTYDFQELGLKHPRFYPAWLVNLLGVDYFASVETLDLSFSRAVSVGLYLVPRK